MRGENKLETCEKTGRESGDKAAEMELEFCTRSEGDTSRDGDQGHKSGGSQTGTEDKVLEQGCANRGERFDGLHERDGDETQTNVSEADVCTEDDGDDEKL